MTGPVLIAVAHGSADPGAAETVAALARQVRRLAPVVQVRTAFLRHGRPALAELAELAGPAEVTWPAGPAGRPAGPARGPKPVPRAVIVPLLLSAGHHLEADVGAAAERAGLPAAAPLGPDPLLSVALARRLAEAGVARGTPVVLAAAGSADPRGPAAVRAQAAMLSQLLRAPVTAAFAAAAGPTVREAVGRHRRAGRPVAVASYLLAPGRFHDLVRSAGADRVARPIGDHAAVAAVVLDRYRGALGAR